MEKITLENFTFQTFTCKSDNWRSIEHITLVARESDIWRSVENITLENFRFHTFACKSDSLLWYVPVIFRGQ